MLNEQPLSVTYRSKENTYFLKLHWTLLAPLICIYSTIYYLYLWYLAMIQENKFWNPDDGCVFLIEIRNVNNEQGHHKLHDGWKYGKNICLNMFRILSNEESKKIIRMLFVFCTIFPFLDQTIHTCLMIWYIITKCRLFLFLHAS